MELKSIEEVCRPKQWKTIPMKKLKKEGYPVYGANGVIGYYDDYTHENDTVMITCRGATCGSINISKGKSYINGNAMALDNLDTNIIDICFLYYFLLGYDFSKIISGSAQPQITRTNLKDLKLPLPPMEVQKKIVEVLDKAQMLIDKRKEQIKLLDDLIEAVFYDMFGDPVVNDKGWEVEKLEDIMKIDTKMITEFEGYLNYPHIGIANIEENTGKLIDYNTIGEDNVRSGKYLFTEKHLIYSKIRPYLNKVAYPKISGLCSADSYPLLTKKSKVNVYYLWYILRTKEFLNIIQRDSSRTNIPKVNKKQLLNVNYIVPPIQLQNEFAKKVELIESQKGFMEKSLKLMENNYNGLMQRAFKGELF